MIIEKCFPALGWRPSTPSHILGYAGLADIDAELEKLAMDARRAPEWICDAHLADQLSYFERHRRPATTASRLPAPVQPENQRDANEQWCQASRSPAHRKSLETTDRDQRVPNSRRP